MLDALRQLLELQKLDDELLADETELEALPAKRAALADERAAAEARLEQAGESLGEAEATQRRAEVELQDKQALLQKLEGQQFQVKSNDAYTALLHEMEVAREAISDRETEILEAMEGIEAAASSRAEAERDCQAVAARAAEQETVLASREQELAVHVAKLRELRDQLCSGIDGALLDQYRKIIARRRPAVVVIEGELCLGCRVDIPPQSFIELLRGEQVITCKTCHRILVHQRALVGAPK